MTCIVEIGIYHLDPEQILKIPPPDTYSTIFSTRNSVNVIIFVQVESAPQRFRVGVEQQSTAVL